MATYQTNAVVLKREDIFEADRLYHLYTEDFGKVKAIAGGVRKINAKLTGHLEPFNLVWVELMTKKGGDLFITTALSEISLLESNASPNLISLFVKMSDFALKMLRGQEKDKAMWNFILENFTKAREIEAGTDPPERLASSSQPDEVILAGRAGKFLNDYKSGFIKIMGFGDNLKEAEYYLSDFDMV